MIDKTEKLLKILGKSRVFLSEPLAKYSSYQIGGPADFFFRAKNIQELITAVNSARKLAIPVFVLGGGTNLLISDRGFRGLIVKNDASNIKLIGIKGKKGGVQTVYLEAESGVTINRLVRFTLDAGFSGLQYFLGQPGTVGGAVYINAHNMKKKIFFGDRVIEASLLQCNGEVKNVSHDYFRFAYDQSRLQTSEEILLSVVIELTRDEKEKLWQEGQEVLNYRKQTQPTGVYSSGCTFRNISKSAAVRLATPNFTTSSGFILESLGLKGKKIGEAMFSEHHANFIVHRGQAKASDVLKLITLAKTKAKERYNLDLKEEIILLGEF